jgi:hypothetical protein
MIGDRHRRADRLPDHSAHLGARSLKRRQPLSEKETTMRSTFAIMIAGPMLAATLPASAADIDWTKVDHALGRSGAAMPGDVHRYGFPRSDLHVTVDGVTLLPAFALGGWLAFKGDDSGAMVMGDLVLTEDEINPVMSKLLAGGVAVTAVHNHLLRTQPTTFYMHVDGHGDAATLATTLHDAVAASHTPLTAPAASASAKPDIDVEQIEQVLGRKGNAAGGVLQFGIPRGDAIVEAGMTVPPAMGTATAVNFQPTGGGKAAITGDFVLAAQEVEPVLTALRGAGIEVTALHNHMINDNPRTFFVHFWANDDAVKLAHGIRAALDKVNVAKS